MMHALDDRTLDNFMPNLKPLDADCAKIYNDYTEYFHQGAVHVGLLAKQLKGAEKIKAQNWSKHIVYKYEQFQKMMNAVVQPKEGEDPVAVYRWNRSDTTQAKKLPKLQSDHKEVAMKWYQYGYKLTCPSWMRFLEQPLY